MLIGPESRVSGCIYREDMDQNSHPFDSHSIEELDHQPPMPWDQLLTAIRRSPHLSAVEAARIAQSQSGASVDVLSPLPASGAPTWDGVHSVINTLKQKNLLPDRLPQTRSASVMLTYLLTELELSISGHRRPRPDLGAASAGPKTEVAQARFESECITWVIAGRLGLRAAATGPLKGYLKHGELIPEFSRDRVLQTVDTIEDLFGGALAFGAVIREATPSLFELDMSLAV
jgi:hypothetical protein